MDNNPVPVGIANIKEKKNPKKRTIGILYGSKQSDELRRPNQKWYVGKRYQTIDLDVEESIMTYSMRIYQRDEQKNYN